MSAKQKRIQACLGKLTNISFQTELYNYDQEISLTLRAGDVMRGVKFPWEGMDLLKTDAEQEYAARHAVAKLLRWYADHLGKAPESCEELTPSEAEIEWVDLPNGNVGVRVGPIVRDGPRIRRRHQHYTNGLPETQGEEKILAMMAACQRCKELGYKP